MNATEAAKRAGYSEKTAYSIGGRLMKNTEIQAAIEAGMMDRQERTALSQDYVIENLREIVTRCMNAESFDPRSATKALELLGKHLGMFTDKLQVKEETGPILFKWADSEDSTTKAGY